MLKAFSRLFSLLGASLFGGHAIVSLFLNKYPIEVTYLVDGKVHTFNLLTYSILGFSVSIVSLAFIQKFSRYKTEYVKIEQKDLARIYINIDRMLAKYQIPYDKNTSPRIVSAVYTDEFEIVKEKR